jgi:hypothetical protein
MAETTDAVIGVKEEVVFKRKSVFRCKYGT